MSNNNKSFRNNDRQKIFIREGRTIPAPCTLITKPNDNSFICLFCSVYCEEAFKLCSSSSSSYGTTSTNSKELFALPSDLGLLRSSFSSCGATTSTKTNKGGDIACLK